MSLATGIMVGLFVFFGITCSTTPEYAGIAGAASCVVTVMTVIGLMVHEELVKIRKHLTK